jgi:recombination protein RecR
VEDPSDLFAIERSSQYRGAYHVLHGTLAPLDGIGPQELKIAELMSRVQSKAPNEVILATNPDVEGDATALYIAGLLKNLHIRSTRIAMGVPMGGHLEYTDQVTLGRAITERREFWAR